MRSTNQEFWKFLDQLVSRNHLVLDRPKGTVHPRFPGMVYPLDYGYLEGTKSMDGGGVDCWIGSGDSTQVTGILCTVDLLKQDTELKILLGCTSENIQQILQFINGNHMQAICMLR